MTPTVGTMRRGYIPCIAEAGEEPLIAPVQLTGQTVVMFSRLPPPTLCIRSIQNLHPKPEKFSQSQGILDT